MRTRMCGMALACAALAAPAAAQSVLTEAEALARLSPDSPRVRAIRAAVAVAEADAASARRWPNPSVGSTRETAAGVTEVITAVTQPLPVTGRRTFEVASAAALAGASSRRADEALRRARAELRLAYAGLAAAQAHERESTRTRDGYQALADVLARREAAGDAAGFDRLRAQREQLEAEIDRQTAAAERRRAQGALAAFLADGPAPDLLVAAEAEPGAEAVPALDALIERAEGARGELAALRQEQEAARFSLRAASRRRLPEPEIVAGTKTSSAGATGAVVGVVATLPLFDRGRVERGQALAREASATARLDAFRQALRAQISTTRDLVLARRTAAAAYRATAVRLSADIERIARVSYDAGERGLLDLIDARRAAAAARGRQSDLDLAVRQAEIDLEFLTGWEFR